MNREIKFRAWDTVLKIMVPSFDNWIDFDGNYWTTPDVTHDTPNTEIVRGHNYILMQFTGLHDKTGKEIYEGDIILEGITRKIITWEDGAFHVRVPDYEPHSGMPTRPLCFDTWSPEGIRFKVIGDIYRNPELIQQ